MVIKYFEMLDAATEIQSTTFTQPLVSIGIFKFKEEQMTAFRCVNALNEEEPSIPNVSIFSESEDFRKMFLEISDSFWQTVFSRRNAQPQACFKTHTK